MKKHNWFKQVISGFISLIAIIMALGSTVQYVFADLSADSKSPVILQWASHSEHQGDDGNIYFETKTVEEATQSFIYQVQISNDSSTEWDAGFMEVRLPSSVVEYRGIDSTIFAGDSPKYSEIGLLQGPSQSSSDIPLTYEESGDELVIRNYDKIQAASTMIFQVKMTIDTVKCESGKTHSFSASFTLGNDTSDTNELKLTVKTEPHVSAFRYYNSKRVITLPENINKPEDFDDYFYYLFRLDVMIDLQPCRMGISVTLPDGAEHVGIFSDSKLTERYPHNDRCEVDLLTKSGTLFVLARYPKSDGRILSSTVCADFSGLENGTHYREQTASVEIPDTSEYQTAFSHKKTLHSQSYYENLLVSGAEGPVRWRIEAALTLSEQDAQETTVEVYDDYYELACGSDTLHLKEGDYEIVRLACYGSLENIDLDTGEITKPKMYADVYYRLSTASSADWIFFEKIPVNTGENTYDHEKAFQLPPGVVQVKAVAATNHQMNMVLYPSISLKYSQRVSEFINKPGYADRVMARNHSLYRVVDEKGRLKNPAEGTYLSYYNTYPAVREYDLAAYGDLGYRSVAQSGAFLVPETGNECAVTAMISENNIVSRLVNVSYDIRATEYVEDCGLQQEDFLAAYGKGAFDEYLPLTNEAVFYALLPFGFIYESCELPPYQANVETVQNYRDSGRTMVIIRIPSSGNDYKKWLQFDGAYVYAGYDIKINCSVPWDNLPDIEDNPLIQFAYQHENAAMRGEAYTDTGGFIGSLFHNLAEKKEVDVSLRNTIYGTHDEQLIAVAVNTINGLAHAVRKAEDRSETFEKKLDVTNGEQYIYRLSLRNGVADGTGNLKNTVIYDRLENLPESQWHGSFHHIDVNGPKLKGIDPVVYYSEKTDAVFDLSHNASGWTTEQPDKHKIKAVAVDLSKKSDGAPYIFEPNSGTSIYLYMDVPDSGIIDGGSTINQGAYTAITELAGNDNRPVTLHSDETAVNFYDSRPKVTVSYEWLTNVVPAGVNLPENETLLLGSGYRAAKVQAPDKWIFHGWYTDKAMKTLFHDGMEIQKNTTLYGKWVPPCTLRIHYVDEDGNTLGPSYESIYMNGSSYSIPSPVVPHYVTMQPSVDGTIQRDLEVTVIYYQRKYPVVIDYLYADSTEAAPQYKGAVAYGEQYTVPSPQIEHFKADTEIVDDFMDSEDGKVHTVWYYPKEYLLTIRLHYNEVGNEPFDISEESYAHGEDYQFKAPVVEGYTADRLFLSGVMPPRDHYLDIVYIKDQIDEDDNNVQNDEEDSNTENDQEDEEDSFEDSSHESDNNENSSDSGSNGAGLKTTEPASSDTNTDAQEDRVVSAVKTNDNLDLAIIFFLSTFLLGSIVIPAVIIR